MSTVEGAMRLDGAETMARVFAGLADRTRLRLLNLMEDQDICVCYFVEILRLPQPTISRHLAYLRRVGLVEARRDGKWMHYRIAAPKEPAARQLLADTLRWLSQDPQLRKERATLTRACCSSKRTAPLVGAPLPRRTGPPAEGAVGPHAQP